MQPGCNRDAAGMRPGFGQVSAANGELRPEYEELGPVDVKLVPVNDELGRVNGKLGPVDDEFEVTASESDKPRRRTYESCNSRPAELRLPPGVRHPQRSESNHVSK